MAEEINIEDLQRCDSDTLPDNIIGVAVRVNDGRDGLHSGIFIKYNGQGSIFHYTGKGIFISAVEDNQWLLFKEFEIISPVISSALAFFHRVKNKSKPKFFYFYAGALFDNNGTSKDPNGLPEYMSCVGFCLAVIKNLLLGRDFINYTDWPIGHGVDEGYLKSFFEDKVKPHHPELSLSDFIEGVRRITPLEYLTAGFSDVVPVDKAFTDLNAPLVRKAIKNKIDNWVTK